MKTNKVYESFFTKVKNLMSDIGKGITIQGVTYHAHPTRYCTKCKIVFSDGRCPNPKCDNTADWSKTVCTKEGCGSRNTFVFQAKEDPNVFFTFCQKCKKYDIGEGLPTLLTKFVSNVPPPIGSKTKPSQEEIDRVTKDLGF